MPFTRRFLHYSPGPNDFVGELECRVVRGARFELHRRGGCGNGEITLLDDATDVARGDWIVFEYSAGDRWYQGQVIDRRLLQPNGARLKLAGMGRQLQDVFPGGFGTGVADGVPPRRYSQSDLFPDDPDHADDVVDAVNDPSDVVRLIGQQFIAPGTDVTIVPARIESPWNGSIVSSLKFRGEEPVDAILRDLAMRIGNGSWGVDAGGQFFFLRQRSNLLATFQKGADLVSLTRAQRHDLLFNRIQLTGGFVYGPPVGVGDSPRSISRWRGHFIVPQSRASYGQRPFAVTLPWVRTQADSIEFPREFFRVYSQPVDAFVAEVADQSALLKPWEGFVRLRDVNGSDLYDGLFETIRVQFDEAPRFRLELGPADPRTIWPQPAVRERSPVPVTAVAGALISFSSSSSSSSSSSA